MRRPALVLLMAGMLVVGAPAAFAQDSSANRRVNVDIGIGSHFRDGGDVESFSIGYAVLPDPATTADDVIYFGGGVRVWLRPSIGVFADAKLLFAVQRGAGSETSAMVPIRAGLTWRF